MKTGILDQLANLLLLLVIKTLMATYRYLPAVVAGIAGFAGGTIYSQSSSPKCFEVCAAHPLLPTPLKSEPMDINESGDQVSQTTRFGFPGYETLRSRKSFVLSYDRRNRVANWVIEHLTADGVRYNEAVDRSKSEFFEDESIHPFFRSNNQDYKRSGYDRGHLAAAGNHRSSQDVMGDTFVLSNISPQIGKGFNRDMWNTLEKHVRHLTKKYKNVYVCTGPLYLPRNEQDGKKYVKYEVIGPNNVAVPTHFFKIVVAETNNQHLDMEAYVMPNAVIDDKVPLKAFMVPKDVIERAAGLLIFEKIPLNSFRSINGKKQTLLS